MIAEYDAFAGAAEAMLIAVVTLPDSTIVSPSATPVAGLWNSSRSLAAIAPALTAVLATVIVFGAPPLTL